MSRCRICAQVATVFPRRTTCVWFQLGRSTAAGGAVPVPVRLWCSKRMRCRKVCECGNLVNALKRLANQLKDGDSPIQSIVAGFCERSRNSITEGLRHFIEEQRQSSRSEQRCMQLCSMQQAFTAWWKIGRTVMSSSRSRKKS